MLAVEPTPTSSSSAYVAKRAPEQIAPSGTSLSAPSPPASGGMSEILPDKWIALVRVAIGPCCKLPLLRHDPTSSDSACRGAVGHREVWLSISMFPFGHARAPKTPS